MRTFIIITLLALTSLSTFAQKASVSTPEVITTGANEEVKNTDGVYAFLGNIEQQNKELSELKNSTNELQKEIETDKNWAQDSEKVAAHTENVEIIEACEQMLATNKRIMEGKITIRSVDTEKN